MREFEFEGSELTESERMNVICEMSAMSFQNQESRMRFLVI
jgi:hypothetical protein